MKNIIFVIPSLKQGGIEQSLINLLNSIPSNKYNITLFLFHEDSSGLKKIPSWIKVYHGNKILDIYGMTLQEAKNISIVTFILRCLIALFCRIFNSNIFCSVLFKFNRISEIYDIAISYSNNISFHSVYFGSNKFVLENIKANKKGTWLHVDYDAMNLDNRVNRKEYRKFDFIICVSNAIKKNFIKYYPELESYTYTIPNLIIVDKLRSNQERLNSKCFKIITVGRLDKNKNQMMAIEVLEKIKDSYKNIKWYFLGDGQDRKKLEKAIIEKKLENNVKILGYNNNVPYFVSNSDLFVSTSLSESYGMAIAESLKIGTPVVALYYPAIREIINGENGIIVYNTEEMVKNIKMLIFNKEEYAKLKGNTRLLGSSKRILNKFYRIIEKEQNVICF